MRQVPKNGGRNFGRESTGIKIYPMGTYYDFLRPQLLQYKFVTFLLDFFFLAVTRLRRYAKRNRFFVTFFEIFLDYVICVISLASNYWIFYFWRRGGSCPPPRTFMLPTCRSGAGNSSRPTLSMYVLSMINPNY